MKCERGGNCGICNFRFSTEVLLAPPLLLDHIDPSRSVCVSERVCVFSYVRVLSNLLSWKLAMLFLRLQRQRGGAGQSCSVRLSVYLCSVNKGKYCIW